MKNIVLSCSQQSGNKCLFGDSEELHTFEIAKRVAELLKQYDANVCLMNKELAGTENNVLAQVVTISNDFCKTNNSASYHLDIHTDGGYSATGSSAFYLSEGGKNFITPIHKEVAGLTPFADGVVSKRDNLFVLRATDATAGLIEVCFHDKQNEAQWLHDNFDSIAAAIVRGLVVGCNLIKKVDDKQVKIDKIIELLRAL